MDCQLNSYSLDYFDQIQEKIGNNKREIAHLDSIIAERKKKYGSCLNAYERYIRKENELLRRNQEHCSMRNKYYIDETKKAWKNTIGNRQLILRSLARTNVIKADADRWLSAMEKEGLNRQDLEQSQEDLQGSNLVHQYNEILRQYMK